MCIQRFVRYDILAAFAIAWIAAVGHASDWRQYMRDACHTADARDERLRLPLHVTASVRLDDAVLTSPAVVAGRVYVVDQMGSAYCIDPQKASIEWKTDPPGASVVGGNTSSPCVIGGKMAYGTTIGSFFLLDANTGDVLKIVAMNQPILGAITAANDRFYLQTLDGVIQCLDADGELCWRFDPYADAPNDPGSLEKRQYSRGEVAVLGDMVVAAAGFDLVCLRDKDDVAEPVWVARKAITDTYLPIGVSLDDGYVYAAHPGKDGKGAVVRYDLETGAMDPDRDVVDDQWAVVTPPATRDGVAYYCRQAFGLTATEFGTRATVSWSSFGEHPDSTNPAIAAPMLAGDHCIFTLLSGGLAVSPLPSERGQVKNARHIRPQVVKTASGAVITSSPAVSDGVVYFGGDDGHLHILRSGRHEEVVTVADRVSQRRSEVRPAGQMRYGWPSAFGGPGDEAMDQAIDAWDAATGKPLWRVKLKSRGKFLNGPAGCAGNGLFYFTGGGEGMRDAGETVAIEPQSGRVLWRSVAFASQTGTPSYKEGLLYLPGTYQQPVTCISAKSGETVWTNNLSIKRWHVDTVALGPDYFAINNKYEGGSWRWDAKTGKPVNLDGEPLQIWGPAHACGAIVLTASGHALSATIGGLCMTNVNTGELVWNTPGFGSYTCPHAIAANGRIFYAPQTGGMLFCFEPCFEDDAHQ